MSNSNSVAWVRGNGSNASNSNCDLCVEFSANVKLTNEQIHTLCISAELCERTINAGVTDAGKSYDQFTVVDGQILLNGVNVVFFQVKNSAGTVNELRAHFESLSVSDINPPKRARATSAQFADLLG